MTEHLGPQGGERELTTGRLKYGLAVRNTHWPCEIDVEMQAWSSAL